MKKVDVEKIKVYKTWVKGSLKVYKNFKMTPCIVARLVYGKECYNLKDSEYCDFCHFYKVEQLRMGLWYML